MLNLFEKTYPLSGIRNSPGFYLKTDNKGTILFASTSMLRHTGLLLTDLLGLPLNKFFQFSDDHFFSFTDADFPADGRRLTAICKGKSPFNVEFTVYKDRDDVLEWISTMLPEAQKTSDHLGKFFLLSSESFCILDTGGNFAEVNDAFAQLLGYSDKELQGRAAIDFMMKEDSKIAEHAIGEAVAEENPLLYEARFQCGNGDVKWLAWSGTIVRNEQMILCAVKDISLRKRTEEKLQKKTEELNNVVSSLDDIVFEYDHEGRFQKVWCRDESMLQLMPRQFLGKSMREAFAALPDFVEPFIHDFEKALWNKEICYRDFSMTIGNEVRWFNSKISPLFNETGDAKGFTQRITDISEKKKVELAVREKNEELKKAHAELRQIIESASEVIFKLDEQGRFIFVSPEFERALGYTKTEVLGKYFGIIVHPDDLAACEEGLATSRRLGKAPAKIIFRVTGKDHRTRWFSTSVTFLKGEKGQATIGIGLAQDISDLKQTMDSLVAAEEKYAAFIKQSSEAIWCFETGKPIYIETPEDEMIDQILNFGYLSECNDVFAKMYGYSTASEISHIPLAELLPPGDPSTHEYLRSFIRSGFKLSDAESIEYDREGEKKSFLNNLIGIIKGGMLVRVWGTQRDITEQRRTEEILRINEERYRSVVHALGEGIIMYDASGTIIAVNKSAENIFGLTSEQFLGRNVFASGLKKVREDGTDFNIMDLPFARTRETGVAMKNVIVGIFREDSTLCWLSVNTEPVYYSEHKDKPDAVVASYVDITEKKYAQEELERHGQQLREYSDRITNILDSITDGFIAVDNDLNILLWNHVIEKVTGIKTSDAIGKNIRTVLAPLGNSPAYQKYMEAILSKTTVNFEHYIQNLNTWFETSAYPSRQGLFIYLRDISHRKKQENLLALEKKVLEINASPSASLKLTVDYFLEGIESIFPGMICSVLTLEEDSQKVKHLSAPSLPVEFSIAIDGLPIGPKAGSCGTAMFTKRPVITSDIFNDPLWEDYRPLAEQFGLSACWCLPILNAQQEVLATIASYYRYPISPKATELDILERVRNLLRIIIENKKAEARIRISNERYILATKATNDAIWDWDFTSDNLFRGEGYFNLFGYKPGYVSKPIERLELAIHPDDKERVVSGLKEFIQGTNRQIWEEEYRFKKADGSYVLVFDRGFLIYNHEGRINRMVGSMQDITEKKELEKQLIKQELDKQKVVAQAVVDAQEKERADIGKELHDNVNQILSTAKLYLELARSDDGERINLIKRSTDNIYNAINEIRTISRSLVPASIGDLGIIESIQDLVENIRATKKLKVEFYYSEGIDQLISEKQKLMLFRIIQEQVNNVLKHSAASNLVIELMEDGGVVDLTVSDNGKGFELDKVKNKKGLGLYNIASRTELFNGKVKIVSSPGQGCTVNIRVPISNY
jgi:PAS domain S-box-containing protein